MKKPIVLKLGGKPLDLSVAMIRPSTIKIKDFLDRQGSEDLFTKEQMAAAADVGLSSAQRFANQKTAYSHTYTIGSRVFLCFGSPDAIKNLQAEITRQKALRVERER